MIPRPAYAGRARPSVDSFVKGAVVDTLRLVVLCIHFLGLAALVGVFLVQARQRTGFHTGVLLTGAITQVVTGLALVGLREATDLPVNNTKIAVKLVIAVIAMVAAILAYVRQNKNPETSVMPWFHTAGGLGLVNILIAVLWT